ncbi:MAG: alpha/beta fold hydrolase [Solirubrobacteraceae bacterium]|jgi:pimeloyl-ACP methyl ester carboxylesterase
MSERACDTIARWFGPAERPLLGWLSVPAGGGGDSGALILPPVGYAYWSVHRTLRTLAERLAGAGYLTLRLDYDGAGDSAGEQSDPERVRAWRASAAEGAAELRGLGVRRLVVFGARFGGWIALRDGAALGAQAVVAWAPVISGRRYAREIRLLASEAPDGSLVAGGTLYLAQTLAELATLDAAGLALTPAPRTLVIASNEGEEMALGERAELLDVAGGECALEQPAEYATVPQEIVAGIVDWLGPARADGRAIEANAVARFDGLREEVVELGQQRLVAIETEPADGAAKATLVLLNTGSEPHIGPGRAWVEYSRALAARGYRCVRADFRGWGESPDDGLAPGRPYDAHCVEDAIAIVRALRERHGGPVVAAGLCASAWVALRVALSEPLDGVIALNPQLYWKPGDPVEATMAETRLRRSTEREREARGGRLGLWSLLDMLGERAWAARWLDELARSGVPITLAFAAGDDGIEFLRNRHARRFSRALRRGSIEVVEIPDIDHAMGRVWLRERIVAVLLERLERIVGR